MSAAVGGRISSTKMKIAFSGASLIRFLFISFVPERRAGGSLPDDIDELTNSQILLVSLVTARCKGHTAGTRYFFLSIVGISLFSAFSQITYRSAFNTKRQVLEAYGNPVGVLLSDSLGFCLTLVCCSKGGMSLRERERQRREEGRCEMRRYRSERDMKVTS